MNKNKNNTQAGKKLNIKKLMSPKNLVRAMCILLVLLMIIPFIANAIALM